MASRPLPTLTLEAAKIASDAAQEKAKEMGVGKNMLLFNKIRVLPFYIILYFILCT